jgi:hypothetical protein
MHLALLPAGGLDFGQGLCCALVAEACCVFACLCAAGTGKTSTLVEAATQVGLVANWLKRCSIMY